MSTIPLLLIGDAPTRPTGFARIAYDLATRIQAEREAWGIDLLYLGADSVGPLPERGVPYAAASGVPMWVYEKDTPGRLGKALNAALATHWPRYTGPLVIWSCFDPARCFELAQWRGDTAFTTHAARASLWGYMAVDGENRHGQISGPALAAVQCYDRVLAYGPYGQRVLTQSGVRGVEALPHGIDRAVFRPAMTAAERAHAIALLCGGAPTGQMVLGCVATNQARKDFPLFFAVLAELRADGFPIRGWFHTDREVGEAWSVPQLAEDFGLGANALTVTTQLTDRELAICYASCIATLAIGRGEGFGYPILESLSCGTPVLHGDYAGGADLLPAGLPRLHPIEDHGFQLVGPYALKRPIFDAHAVAAQVRQVIQDRGEGQPYMHQLTTHAEAYDWPVLWPRWRDWITRGLEPLRGA